MKKIIAINSVTSSHGGNCYQCNKYTTLLPTILGTNDVYFHGYMCSKKCEEQFLEEAKNETI